MPPDEKARARLLNTPAQKLATGPAIAAPPVGSFFASSLLICKSVEPLSVALTSDWTAPLFGALDSREKFAGPGEEGRSE